MTTSRGWWAGKLILCVLMMAYAGGNQAQEKKVHEKHDASALYSSLREVINQGAKIYNEQGDHAGCYRLYQGSLLSVRPFLAPDLLKKIDEGLTKAESMQNFSERAFELRRIIDEVRTQVRPANLLTKEEKKEEKKIDDKKDDKKKEEKKIDDKKDDKKKEEKKIDDKKSEEKKADDKKSVDKKSTEPGNDKGQIIGKVTLQGKAITGGYFVTLISKEGKKFSSALQKDGSFQLKTPVPVGEYRIIVEPIPGEKNVAVEVPARYRNDSTTDLTIHVQSGRQNLELNLTK